MNETKKVLALFSSESTEVLIRSFDLSVQLSIEQNIESATQLFQEGGFHVVVTDSTDFVCLVEKRNKLQKEHGVARVPIVFVDPRSEFCGMARRMGADAFWHMHHVGPGLSDLLAKY